MLLPFTQSFPQELQRTASLAVTVLLIIFLIIVELSGNDEITHRKKELSVFYPMIILFLLMVGIFIVQQFMAVK